MPRTATTKAATKAPTRAPRRAPSKASSINALELLKEDHKKVKKMFKQFEKLKEDKKASDNDKQSLVEAACAELTVHAQIEEELFYPALRDAISDSDLLDEATVEHASAKALIQELQSMRPGDELYEAKFTVLGEYVQHHIEEEEKEIFPKAKKAKLDLAGIGEELRQRREELRLQLGVPGDMEAVSASRKVAATKRKNMH